MIIIRPVMSVSVLAIFLAFCNVSCVAESVTRTPEQTFNGTVVAKGWSKSGESYCHGGSEYFVLDTGDLKLTIESDRSVEPRGTTLSKLKSFQNQKVQIVGTVVTRTMSVNEHCPDPMMQCVSGPMSCRYIEVKDIRRVGG